MSNINATTEEKSERNMRERENPISGRRLARIIGSFPRLSTNAQAVKITAARANITYVRSKGENSFEAALLRTLNNAPEITAPIKRSTPGRVTGLLSPPPTETIITPATVHIPHKSCRIVNFSPIKTVAKIKANKGTTAIRVPEKEEFVSSIP